jgi:zinc protease
MNDFRDTLEAVKAGYNPRGNHLTRDDVDGFDLDKAYNIYKERFADASNFTFVFVGAFTINEMKPFIEQYIASLPSTNKKEKAKDLKIRPVSGIEKKIVKRGIEPKSTVCLVMDNDYNFSSEENLKVNIINEILDINVRDSIREEKGGTYSIGALVNTGYFPRQYVRVEVYWACDPERVEELIGAAYNVFDYMQNTVTPENLAKAKELIKKEFDVNMQRNNY